MTLENDRSRRRICDSRRRRVTPPEAAVQFHTPTAREVARRSRVRRLRAAIRLVSRAALVTACYWLAEAGELLGVPAAQLICSLAVGAALALGVATLLTIAICAAIAVALARTSGVSTTEAVLGMAPGGSAAIISTAAELDADSRTVAAAQYLRVAMIALVAPLVVAVVAGGAEGIPPPELGSARTSGILTASAGLWPAVVLAAVCIAGATTGHWVKLPSALLLARCWSQCCSPSPAGHTVSLPPAPTGRYQRGPRHHGHHQHRRAAGPHRAEPAARDRDPHRATAAALAHPHLRQARAARRGVNNCSYRSVSVSGANSPTTNSVMLLRIGPGTPCANFFR